MRSVVALIVAFVGWTSLVVTGGGARLPASRMSPRVVQTSQGKLRAVLVARPELAGLPPVEVFLGVQYASTLGSELRFMPPTASMEKWDGVRVALQHRPVCPQRLGDLDRPGTAAAAAETPPLRRRGRAERLRRLLPFIEKQSEDCLNLNVFVPFTGRPAVFINRTRVDRVFSCVCDSVSLFVCSFYFSCSKRKTA